MKQIMNCECGGAGTIVFIHNSALRLRVVGCEACHTTGPARMDNDSAIEQWNSGKRNDANGNRLPPVSTYA